MLENFSGREKKKEAWYMKKKSERVPKVINLFLGSALANSLHSGTKTKQRRRKRVREKEKKLLILLLVSSSSLVDPPRARRRTKKKKRIIEGFLFSGNLRKTDKWAQVWDRRRLISLL